MREDARIVTLVNIVNVNSVYLLVFDYKFGDLHIYRDVPDDIENLEKFISINLGYPLNEVKYITMKEDNAIYYNTYNNKKIIENGMSLIEDVF